MLRFVFAQLRGRPRRTVALLAGVLVATTGFTVLSAGAAVQRLQVESTVAAHARSAYDILVRPRGSRNDLERERGLIAPNSLSGSYGGISLAQLDQIRAAGNVEVAAPIAMLGYVKLQLNQTVDLTDQVDPTARRQLFRITPSVIANHGLTVLDDAPRYVYLSRNRLVAEDSDYGKWADGTYWVGGMEGCVTVREVVSAEEFRQVCVRPYEDWETADGTTARERTRVEPYWVNENGQYLNAIADRGAPPGDRLVVTVTWNVMVLAAAIDPAAEAELVGLDDAIVSGRYLSPTDRPARTRDPRSTDERDQYFTGIPALTANARYLDEQVELSVESLGPELAETAVDREWDDWVPRLADVKGASAGEPVRVSSNPWLDADVAYADASIMYRVGPPSYHTGADGVLRPEVRTPDPEAWTIRDVGVYFDLPPRLVAEKGFRRLTRLGGTMSSSRRKPEYTQVGKFDPARISDFSPLTTVPLETYQAPRAVGADQRSRDLLGGEALRPNSNPADYLNTPPLILTNLDSLSAITSLWREDEPVSAVRVRVAGVTGVDERSQELLRTTAERIATTTGLDVDVTLGSSPQPLTVALSAGGGRPGLTLTEDWSRKGAAVAIVQAADRKSLVLFGLILVVCTLFLANAVTAAVRDRRRELAVLTCLGWPARRLAGVVLAEVVGVGLIAGVLSGALAMGLADTAGAPITLQHALIAVPVALGIAVLAAVAPALLAARSRPLAALRPPARVRRVRHRTSVLGLALGNLWRVPGRTALGVTALAVGVGALTVLVVLAFAFTDDVVGTLLGDAVALRVRTVDLVAAITAVSLGVLMIADLLYINIRERAAELATLWASGWSNHALLRLVGYEGLAMGAVGAVLGSGLGLLGVSVFAGEIRPRMVWLAAGIAVAAVVVAGLAAVVPALVLRRLPLATLLAEE
ncbi:hypothetical protein BLA60_03320 [Actinophytocola xinjiangensis]|uniref:ABC3 transporter permease C-terminal domain-containing protein n=1 Tax=Actinophytocola xinjiangensis TaxID=485602 RepID=A0A7Z0WRY8_9PSEU|nr:FtsX-like permease family protein [Actinophytocola xinjiangensis]OLF14190.1 hypothetical protein BLA60_03320 [Actinophytocola xinjiangensis]